MKWRICLIHIFLVLSYCVAYAESKLEIKGVEEYFSASYTEARIKFIKSVIEVDADIESLKNPNNGPGDEELYTDIALFGPENAKTFLVLISGTHGVEGFAGSGIQTGLIRKGFFNELPPDTGIIMIHSLNPYGLAHIRRFDENNIDPNRNFFDHSKPHPVNKGYDELSESISPRSISLFSNIRSIFRLSGYGIKYGLTPLKVAISGGQYSDPEGLFYGGRFKTWENLTLEYIVEKYLTKAERVIVLDFHTGLGDYGELEIISNEKEDSSVYKLAKEIWGAKVKTTYSEKSVSIHLGNTLKLALPRMLSDAEVTVVSAEFGTLSPLRVFWALRSENWLHHHGSREHPKAKKIKTKLLQAFYPNDPKWKVEVWSQGKEVVEQSLIYLK